MKALVVLITIFILIAIFGKDLGHTYNKLTWTPPMEINGITTGMTKSDVVFKLGENVECLDGIIVCSWANQSVFFENEIVDFQSLGGTYFSSIPFKNTKGMKSLLGDEDILAVSKDFNIRRYTYVKWGATFDYKNDVLTTYMIGNTVWRHVGENSKYVINGVVVCPGAECPIDDKGDVKEDFKDRDYTYFIK